MSVELRHDIDPGLQAIAAFLLNRQLRQGSAPPSAPGAATPTANPMEALQAIAQQQAMQALSQEPASPLPPRAASAAVDPSMDPRLALEKYRIDQQAATQRGIAGMNFVQDQFNQSVGHFNQMALADHEAEIHAREIAQQHGFTSAEHQKAFEQQQLMAEIGANLDAVGKVQQTAPAILDVDQVREAARRIQNNREALTEPERYARQQLMDKIATGDPVAMQEGLRQGLLYWSPEQESIIRSTKEEMQKISQDPRYTPAERARALAILGQRLNSMRPMETPTHKVPLSPLEEFHQNTVEYPNPSGGPAYLYHKTFRDGRMKLEVDQNRLKDIERWNNQQYDLWQKEHGINQKNDPKELQRKAAYARQKQAGDMLGLFSKQRAEIQTKYDLAVADAAAAETAYNQKKDDQTNDPSEDVAAQQAYEKAKVNREQANSTLQIYDNLLAHYAAELNSANGEAARIDNEQGGGAAPQTGAPPAGMADSLPARSGGIGMPAPPPPQQVPPQPPQSQAPSTPQAPRIQVASQQDLVKALLTNQVGEGDWIMTSRGPVQLTPDSIARALGQQQ